MGGLYVCAYFLAFMFFDAHTNTSYELLVPPGRPQTTCPASGSFQSPSAGSWWGIQRGLFSTGSFQACPSCSSPASSVSLQCLLSIFSINGHCSLIENNLTRKPGFSPSSQVIFFFFFLSCLEVRGRGTNHSLQLQFWNWFLDICGYSYPLSVDSCCWRSKTSYQRLSEWGNEASHTGSCLMGQG